VTVTVTLVGTFAGVLISRCWPIRCRHRLLLRPPAVVRRVFNPAVKRWPRSAVHLVTHYLQIQDSHWALILPYPSLWPLVRCSCSGLTSSTYRASSSTRQGGRAASGASSSRSASRSRGRAGDRGPVVRAVRTGTTGTRTAISSKTPRWCRSSTALSDLDHSRSCRRAARRSASRSPSLGADGDRGPRDRSDHPRLLAVQKHFVSGITLGGVKGD